MAPSATALVLSESIIIVLILKASSLTLKYENFFIFVDNKLKISSPVCITKLNRKASQIETDLASINAKGIMNVDENL